MKMNRRCVLITGVTSGIGHHLLSLHLDRGDRVLSIVRGGRPRLEGIFGERKIPQDCEIFDADLSNPECIPSIVSEIRGRLGIRSIDLLVNNAGVGYLGPYEAYDWAEIEMQLRVNLHSPMRLIRELLPELRKARGRIINVTSIAGLIPIPLYSNYCVGKFALQSLGDSITWELEREGVQVCSIAPGAIRTQFNQAMVAKLDDLQGRPGNAHLRDLIRSFHAAMKLKSAKVGMSAEKVARKIFNVSNRARLPRRMILGLDAKAFWILQSILPAFLFRKVFEKGFSLVLLGKPEP